MSPPVARSYAAAQSSVDRLVRALGDLGANRVCIAASALVGEVQHVLDRLGWSGRRAQLQRQPAMPGGCGLFLGTGSSFSDPTASLDASHHAVRADPGTQRRELGWLNSKAGPAEAFGGGPSAGQFH
jgi:hypothetical protein